MRKLLFTTCLLSLFFISNAQSPELQKLWRKQQQGKNELVIEKGKALLEKEPENIEYNHLIGRAYYSKGDVDSAIIYLLKSTLTDDPKSYTKAWGYNFLGKCYLLKNELVIAEEYFYKSFKMQATENVTSSSYRYAVTNGLLKNYDDWTRIETNHFVFYFQDSLKAERFVEIREQAYSYISEYLNVCLDEKIRYVVWNSREDALNVMNMNIGFARPTNYLIHSKSTQTPGHEIAHVISHFVSKIEYKSGLINEGLAVYLDMDDKNENAIVKKSMEKYNMDKISIIGFWNNWQNYKDDISYPLAGLFVGEMIEKYGKEKFLEFFADQSYKNAKQVFGNDFDDFIKEFESRFN